MATITLRSVKGSPLTNAEVDANFSNINTELGTKLSATGGTLTGGITVPSVTLSGSGGEPGVATLTWNDTAGTLDLGLKGGNVTMQIGEELFLRVTNSTGSAIPKGSVVYITGSTGNHVNVVLAQANSESTSSKTLGITAETIANAQTGFVATNGIVSGLDTSTLTEGGAVWLSATVAGGLTSTRPSPPNHAVLIGWCVKSHASVGALYIHIANGYEVAELHDVLLTSIANNQVLSYESASGLWKNRSLATVANTGAFSDILSKPTTLSGYGITDAPTVTGTGASGTWGISITGNAATATRLINLRTINGVGFDGTADITIADSTKLPLSGGTLTGNLIVNHAVGGSNLENGNGVVFNGNYTNGQYSHRWRKWDDSGGVPLYLQWTSGTANSWANLARFGSNSADGNWLRVFGPGRFDGALTENGNQVLHAGNYSSYAFRAVTVEGGITAPAGGLNGAVQGWAAYDGYGAAVPNYPNNEWWVGAFTGGNSNRGFQIAGGYSDSEMYFRKGNSGWAAWRRTLTDANYSSYALPLAGGTLTGTLVGTTGQFRKNQTAGNYTTAALWTESFGNTATGIAFHISGNVGKFLEMRTDGILYWNGDTVMHSGNYSSWALPLSGGTLTGGLSGTTGSFSGAVTWGDGSSVMNAGNRRSLRIGYSGGNYGAAGYGIDFTTSSGVHNYALNDIVSLWEAYDGITVRAAAAGTVGTAVPWSTVLDARRSNSNMTFNGNVVLASNNYGSYALPLTGGMITGPLTYRLETSGSGEPWHHQLHLGRYDARYTGGQYPNYLPGAAFGLHVNQSSDAVFVGLISRGANSNDYNAVIAWGDDSEDVLQFRFNNGTVATLTPTGAFNAAGALTQAGNQVLHAANYGSYALPLSGGTVTGATTFNAAINANGRDQRIFENNSFIEFTVGGDANTYYPVRFDVYAWFHFGRWSISRGYADTAPWDPIGTGVHRGGLTLTWEWSGDGAWGGNDKTIRVIQFAESYTTMVGGMALSVNGFIVWLRGGGAYYRFHGSGGQYNGATPYYSTFTASNGATYSPRSYNSGTVASEVTARMPIRGESEHWDGNNRVLHAGNYNSYAPTLGGTGATGTWGISITGSAGSVAASGITGQTGMWTSAGRPGPYRLYRNDSDDAYNIQTTWSADRSGYWSLRGYSNDTYHAPCYVAYSGYADSAGSAGSISGQANSATITASTGVNGNHIVQRDGNGYIYANHINFNTSESENPSINSFFTSNGDGWSRKSSLAHVKNQIRGVADGTWGINISGSAAQLNGYSSAENGASVVLRTASNGYLYLYNWIHVASGGLFSGVNGAHFYPSNASYGAWRMDGSNNGWGGIAFGNGSAGIVNLMTASDSNSTGFHNQSYGWQFQWANGVFYIAKNAYGGNMATALDSSNYTNYSPPYSGGTLTGTWYFTGNGNTGSSSSPALQAYSTGGNGAYMSFHRGGYYAVNMGLDSDNVIRIGGWSASANRWQLDMSGNGTYAGNVTAYSDERLKKDWAGLPENFVERLAGIKSGTFTRIDSGARQAGSSAQDWQKLLPEVVSEDNDGTLALAYGNAAVVSAVELAKEIVAIKRELEALKARLH